MPLFGHCRNSHNDKFLAIIIELELQALMAKILFRLRQVPDDEADEVRALLDANHIDWYETSAGRFQISFPAIWLRDESQEPQARALLQEYQLQRAQRMQDDPAAQETFIQRFTAHPLSIVLAILAIGFVLYISINPFIGLITP